MTSDDVRDRVEYIRSIARDDERAHAHEDRLYLEVLQAIAEGHPEASALAREALRAADIEFARWCA